MASQPTMNIYINNIRQGDVISLPQPPETYSDNSPNTYQPGEHLKITRSWWNRQTSRHVIQLDSYHRDAIVAFDRSSDIATLHERPGFGPFDAVYQVGQKVYVHWMSETLTGIVVHEIHLDNESVYTVRTQRGTLAYVGPENTRADHSPLPAEGQQWVCLHGRHKGMILTVTVPDGLEALCRNGRTGDFNRYILASVNYGLTVDTAPEPAGKLGVDYEDVEMEISGSTRMVRVFR